LQSESLDLGRALHFHLAVSGNVLCFQASLSRVCSGICWFQALAICPYLTVIFQRDERGIYGRFYVSHLLSRSAEKSAKPVYGNFVSLKVPKSVMKDSTDKARKIELLGAASLSLAMVALIFVVQRFAVVPPNVIESVQQDPISVFPDFASIERVDVKKQQFFDYLQGYVEAENSRIMEVREQLLAYSAIVGSGVGLSRRERQDVLQLAVKYELDADLNSDRRIISALLARVDVIPTSLVLAQAANESAWGTSRFALEGNNIFGQWCYEEGCGIVPERRIRGAKHEVKRFDSVVSAVEAYFLNINSHHLYQDFRDLRARMRRQQKELDPMELAYGLGRYSERGDNYVDEVQTIIEQNELRQRDRS